MFVINCKNYEEISGDKIIKFVKIAEKVSKKYKVKIAISPPQHLKPKTKRSNQQEEWMTDHFIQGTAYSEMFKELTGIEIKQVVILVSSEKNTRMEFVKKTVDYKDLLTAEGDPIAPSSTLKNLPEVPQDFFSSGDSLSNSARNASPPEGPGDAAVILIDAQRSEY